MKLVKAFFHHRRTAEVVTALHDAGYRRLSLLDAKGTLRQFLEAEVDFSVDGAGLVIAETQLELVCEDFEVAAVTAIIGTHGRIGPDPSGVMYVSPVEQAIPIGDGLPQSAQGALP